MTNTFPDLINVFDFIFNPFKGFVTNIWEHPIYLVEICVLAFIVWKIYSRIKGTQAEQLLKGILVIIAAWILSNAFHLVIISKVLENLVSVVLVGLVVIFQPELRRILGYLGQTGVFSRNIFSFDSEDDIKNLVNSLCEAVKHLSKKHVGALIVLEESPSAEAFLEVGTPVNADVSTELILTIFHPNTPLHDGAIVINGTKIIAAGVLLPLTEDPKLSWQYGTRHRAAIGMSELSNSLCIVVSEETGEVSMAKHGVLKKYPEIADLSAALKEVYDSLYSPKAKSEVTTPAFQNILQQDITKISKIFSSKKNQDI
ncbi:MAG: diadenylate cyclase CdaA [Vampirovibrionia bacterium]